MVELKNESERRADRSYRRKLWRLITAVYVVPYLTLAAIAIFWPADSGFLGVDFRDSWFANAVPSISGYVSQSAFPAATAAYFVLSGLLSLPYLVIGLRDPVAVMSFGSYQKVEEGKRKYNSRIMPVRLLSFVFCIFAIWVMWAQPGYQFDSIPVHENRWALALGGVLLSFFTVACIFINSAGLCVRCLMNLTLSDECR